jgi:hypothetical protein
MNRDRDRLQTLRQENQQLKTAVKLTISAIQSVESRCSANVAGQHVNLLEKKLEHLAEQVRMAKGQVVSSSKF